MSGRGGWKTVLKYTVGILALAVSVAAAWFLPGWYAGWQDARLEGQPVLSHRDSITFLDTDYLDSAGRLQILEQQAEVFQWERGFSYSVMSPVFDDSETVNRCHDIMRKWCDANLFPEECLACIDTDALLLQEPVSVYLENTILPVWLLHFYTVNGYSATIVLDWDVDLIYYAAVCGPGMLDVIASDLGYDSFGAFAEYELQVLGEKGIDPQTIVEGYEDDTLLEFLVKECSQQVSPTDLSRYDFAAVCGAQEAEAHRSGEYYNLALNINLPFEHFVGHAFRTLAAMSYEKADSLNVGFAVMYGTWRWQQVVSEIASEYGCGEEQLTEDTADWYSAGILYLFGDSETHEAFGYPPQETAESMQFDAENDEAAAAGKAASSGSDWQEPGEPAPFEGYDFVADSVTIAGENAEPPASGGAAAEIPAENPE